MPDIFIKAATNDYFHYQFNLSIIFSINRLVVWSIKCQKNGEKC